MKSLMHEAVDPIAKRASDRQGWWAEPSGQGDGLYLVRSPDQVIAEGLTQQQAMTIAAEYNLARSDALVLARVRSRRRMRKSA